MAIQTRSLCACGCEQKFDKYDSRGRTRKYIHGHNRKGVSSWNKGLDWQPSSAFKKGCDTWNKGVPNLEMRGEKNPAWKGGVTPINHMIRGSIEYKRWREAVYIRDDYTCRLCFQKGGKLQADHIKPFSLFPEVRFSVDNGRTLCVKCHISTDTYMGNMRGKTREDFLYGYSV